MSEYIELNPAQAYALIRARNAEMARERHHAEPWQSQAEMDRSNRDYWEDEAVLLGVPEGQVHRFIYWTEASE